MRKNQLWQIALVFAFSLALTKPVLAGEPSVSINRGDSTTKTRAVTLWFVPSSSPAQYIRVGESPTLSDAGWETFFSQRSWTLSPGPGTKTVYVQFRDRSGLLSPIISDSIVLTLPASPTLDFTVNNNGAETNSRYVNLTLNYTEGVETVALSNTADGFGTPVAVQKNLTWVLSPGTGNKTVYLRYVDGYGNSKVVTKKIHYTEPGRYLKEGTLIKGLDDTIYYYGFDGKLHAFLHSGIYHSWYKDFMNVTVVSQPKLREYEIGNPMCVRPGTWLLRFTNSPRVYAVEPGCILRPIRSEAEAHILYGQDWQKRIMDMDPFYEIFYHVKILTNFQAYDDRDRDGIDYRQEQMYGSSDYKVDSDSDGVSDYEEIVYWFSDPTRTDTDADGVSDGKEVVRNQSPVGFGELKKVPEGTYEYPLGSVIFNPETKTTVYRDIDGTYSTKKKDTKDQPGVPFAESFVIHPTVLISFPKSKTSKSVEPPFLRYPVTEQGGTYLSQ